nr:hypothetical protein [Tanacetum cinerariifolium]
MLTRGEGVASASLGLVAGFVTVVTRRVVFAIALILLGVILGIGSHGWRQLIDLKVGMNVATRRRSYLGADPTIGLWRESKNKALRVNVAPSKAREDGERHQESRHDRPDQIMLQQVGTIRGTKQNARPTRVEHHAG